MTDRDGDARAVRELLAASRPGAVHTFRHYVYAPSRDVAGLIAREMQNRGFHVEQRLGADGANWLVLATHDAVPSADLLTSTRRFIEAVIAGCDGEYDGWEAEVPD